MRAIGLVGSRAVRHAESRIVLPACIPVNVRAESTASAAAGCMRATYLLFDLRSWNTSFGTLQRLGKGSLGSLAEAGCVQKEAPAVPRPLGTHDAARCRSVARPGKCVPLDFLEGQALINTEDPTLPPPAHRGLPPSSRDQSGQRRASS